MRDSERGLPMNKDIILHIGLHKTATKLMQLDIFPKLKGIFQLTKPYRDNPSFGSVLNHLCYEDESLYDSEAIKGIINEVEHNRILISDEDLSGRPIGFGGCINRAVAANRLKRAFPDAKVLLVIRGQESMIFSTYNQYIKGPSKGTLPIEKCLIKGDYNPRALHIHLNTFKYFELVQLYKKLFKEVLVILYEDIQGNPERMLDQLERFCDSKFDSSKRVFNKVHSTPKSRQMQTARFVNRYRDLFGLNYSTKIALRIYRNFYLPLTSRETSEMEFIRRFSNGFYDENNKALMQLCPELEIHKYRKHYPH